MPLAIHCPHCRRMLRLQDADVGKMVRCPSCAQAFAARVDEEAPLPSAVPDFELSSTEPPTHHAVQPKTPPREEGQPNLRRLSVDPKDVYAVQLDEEEASIAWEEEESRRRRRTAHWDEYESDVQPHRGVLILILGILSLVLACIPIIGWILGGIAMNLAANDHRLMDSRVMDRSGRTLTRAGQVCAIFGVFFSTIMFIINLVLYVKSLPYR